MTDETPGPQGRKLSLAPLEFEEALRDLLAAGPRPTKDDPPQDDPPHRRRNPRRVAGVSRWSVRIGLGRAETGRVGLSPAQDGSKGHSDRG